jgi:hypothetical protein
MDQEKSLDFLGYPNYVIHLSGHVMNLITGRLLEGSLGKDGYKIICLHNNFGKKNFKIHRLIGLAFIPAVAGKNTIDHINRDKLDNRIENLRWADNFEQAQNTGVSKLNKLGHKHISKYRKSFRVQIIINYIIVFEKLFKTLEEAIIARDFVLSTD